jgi:hypothetical protein
MTGAKQTKEYFGKYRGTVVNNVDPQFIGRLQLQVPDVLGMALSSWAMPCFPFAGVQTGFYCVPPVGAGVWVEFEQGNPDYPIWVGGFYGSKAEVPSLALVIPPGLPGAVIQTGPNHGILVTSLPGPPGGIVFQTTSGARVDISDAMINVINGKGAQLNLTGTAVTINRDGLVVAF